MQELAKRKSENDMLILFPNGAIITQVQEVPGGNFCGKLGLSMTPRNPVKFVLHSKRMRKQKKILLLLY